MQHFVTKNEDTSLREQPLCSDLTTPEGLATAVRFLGFMQKNFPGWKPQRGKKVEHLVRLSNGLLLACLLSCSLTASAVPQHPPSIAVLTRCCRLPLEITAHFQAWSAEPWCREHYLCWAQFSVQTPAPLQGPLPWASGGTQRSS